MTIDLGFKKGGGDGLSRFKKYVTCCKSLTGSSAWSWLRIFYIIRIRHHVRSVPISAGRLYIIMQGSMALIRLLLRITMMMRLKRF